jgi:uncharacterized protein with NAD-binding domain and iron-sulfur cluster
MADQRTVAVIGGGIGGLSAAHELAERGFSVTVYERRDAPGGKARSIEKKNSGTGGRLDLPGEHGFRFFPGFYKHVTDTMSRIPFGTTGKSCLDNLVVATRILLARAGRPEVTWVGRFPQSLADWHAVLRELFTTNLDIPVNEAEFFASRMLGLATSCEERFLHEFEAIPFWDFVNAPKMSLNYQKYLAEGFTRSLVAMKSEVSSTRTVGRILLQLFYGILIPGRTFDRLLDGPTDDVWIDPWVKYLTGPLKVNLIGSAEATSLNLDGNRISSVTIARNGSCEEVTADYYVCAVPVERMQKLASGAIRAAAPSLQNIDKLQTAWMNGIQFYLRTDEPLTDGHAIFLDSNWALTGISQRQFWRSYDLSKYGNGQVGGILSVDISNWEAPGNFNNKAAKHCASQDEIKDEVWAQLKVALNTGGKVQLEDSNLVEYFMDPDIQWPNPTETTNAEPLLINTAGSLQYRPDAATAIPNLFLASDYVHTYTDLATMEGANEAARRATNAILAASGSTADPCQLFSFDIPDLLRGLQEIDLLQFKLGKQNLILEFGVSGSQAVAT